MMREQQRRTEMHQKHSTVLLRLGRVHSKTMRDYGAVVETKRTPSVTTQTVAGPVPSVGVLWPRTVSFACSTCATLANAKKEIGG